MSGPPVMRIAYLLAEPLSGVSGVARKVHAQVAAWREQGHEVEVATLDGAVGGVSLLRTFDRLCRSVLSGPELDVVYLRQNVFVPSLARVQHRFPTVVEMNSDDIAELATRRPGFRAWHRLTRGQVLRLAAGVVVPTEELGSRPHIAGHGSPVAVIPNAVDLGASPSYPAPANPRPRLAFTYSSPGPWSGVDLFSRLAAALPDLDFDIVGPTPGPSPPNVCVHGPLAGQAYDRIVAQADVGVGSLGLHRIGLREGCTLKVRGYLAAGIPTAIGYRDSDFPGGAPFLLELEPTEHIEQHAPRLAAFAAEMVGKRVPRQDVAHLDIGAKERERLAFMTRCAGLEPKAP